MPSRDLINKNLLKFKRRLFLRERPRLTQTVRENPKAETTAAGCESASAAARVMTSRMVKTSRILQWAIRSEAPFKWRTSRDCKGWDGRRPHGARPSNIQSGPCESSAEKRKAWGKSRAGELLGSERVFYGSLSRTCIQMLSSTDIFRSVGEPAEGSLPRDPQIHIPTLFKKRTLVHSALRALLAPAAHPTPNKPQQPHNPLNKQPEPLRILTGPALIKQPNRKQLLAMDILALATMKNAAKCDT